MSTAATLLTVVGAFIVCLGIYAGFWIWIDAREAAAQRRREAEMADALTRSVRQARGRYTHDERTPE